MRKRLSADRQKMKLHLRILQKGKTSRAGAAIFLIVRDEDYLLPYYFNHYRAIGFEEFLVYADRCSATTLGILAAQPDVTILSGDYEFGQSFGNKPSGYPRLLDAFLKESLGELLPNRWALVADADEFLFLPPPSSDINQFIKVLERSNQPYATAPMVDMYPQCLALRNYPTTISPFQMSIFFDAGPYYVWEPAKLTPRVFHGGVRHRIHYLLSQRFPSELEKIYEARGVAPLCVYKVPLVKHGVGIAHVGNHKINISPTQANAMALAHFKFLPDLDQKIATAVREQQYFAGSVEYRVLELAVDKLPFEMLVCARSRQFTGRDSLVAGSLL
jgi:hypothetical protein